MFLVVFCYKHSAEGITLYQVMPDDTYGLAEENEIKVDEQKKPKLEKDDILYLPNLSIPTFNGLLCVLSLVDHTKPLSGYPILLFPPPNLPKLFYSLPLL
jgi:hypothetical protein